MGAAEYSEGAVIVVLKVREDVEFEFEGESEEGWEG